MRISRLFFKHHFNSQLLCCPTECGDADVLEGGVWDAKKEKTALKPASCWSLSLFLKSASTKIPLKNLIGEETASALKDGKQLCLFASPSSYPLLHHHPLPPLFSSPRCCYSECLMLAHTIRTPSSSSRHETLPFASRAASYSCSSSLFTFSTPHKSRKKKNWAVGWWGRVAVRTEGEQEEGNAGCSLILL